MNTSDLTNSTSIPTAATAETCRIWKEEYHKENYVFTLAAVILNIVTCPLTVCVNLLVIVAVKRKPRLQTIYNLLLCALATTDMVVGAVIQPSYVVGEMSLLTGSSLTEYCTQYTRVALLFLSPCIASLLLLALLSIERYLAMKFSLRYRYHNQGSGSHGCYYLLGHCCSSSSFPIFIHTPSSAFDNSCFHSEWEPYSDFLLSHFCLFCYPTSHD